MILRVLSGTFRIGGTKLIRTEEDKERAELDALDLRNFDVSDNIFYFIYYFVVFISFIVFFFFFFF
jgi:hypothetical protein